MDNSFFSSKLLAEAVEQFAKLPGVGKKTALRHVLYLLDRDLEEVANFANSILKLKQEIKYCKICHNLSDNEICDICANPHRHKDIICVVEDVKDIIAIEKTQQYNGVYHVLGGLISPVDGIGPQDLNINSLEERIKKNKVKEVIFALNTTMEGETTGFYLFKKLNKYPVKITTIARGVGFGDELEYTDELTLGKAIAQRVQYQQAMYKTKN